MQTLRHAEPIYAEAKKRMHMQQLINAKLRNANANECIRHAKAPTCNAKQWKH